MNYLQQNCQRTNKTVFIGFFFCLFFIGCSSDPQPVAGKREAVGVKAKPVWFNAPERFRFLNEVNEIVAHPFFDLSAFKTKERPEISFYLTTPVDSLHSYKLNMVSGQLFRNRTYCSQKDIWESYGPSIYKPSFSQGIIPRLLDQTGEPQNIWVFGARDELIKDERGLSVQSQRARVVGGVLLQYCGEYPCRAQKGWLSQLILIGVNPFDPNFEDVKTFKQLKDKVDWSYVKAFAENGFGRTKNGPKPVPAYRLVGEIEGQVALDNAYKYGHEFDFEEINSLRKNCYYLYDYLWRSQKKIRATMKKSRDQVQNEEALYTKRAKELLEIARFRRNTVINDNIRAEVKKDEEAAENEKRMLDWARYFFTFHNKYGERFKTCSKFVRPANPKENRERFWFFAYMMNWFQLEDLNYYYLCGRRTWVENTRTANGKRRYDVNAPRRCSSQELDQSFEMAVTVMSSLGNSNKPHYRFREFDNGIGGSHKEIFAWNFSKGKTLGCNARKLEEKPPIFPIDISWDKFSGNIKRGRYDVIR